MSKGKKELLRPGVLVDDVQTSFEKATYEDKLSNAQTAVLICNREWNNSGLPFPATGGEW